MNHQDIQALDFQDRAPVAAPTARRQDACATPAPTPGNRREFLKQFGAGIIIFVSLGDLDLGLAAQAARQRGGRGGGLPADFNAFLKIGEDGRVTCFTGKIEMGQGPITSLPQMLAEELETPIETVDIVMGDTDRCPWDMGTFGSMTTPVFGPALQRAAAQAKAVLLELAADSLKLPQSQLAVKDGVIFDQQNKEHRVTYGQLAKGRRIERRLEGKEVLKAVSEYKIIGKPMLRRDAEVKVTGQAQFAGDMRLPGMLYARLVRPPAHGAKLRSADLDACKQLPGVQVIQEDDLVAVLHELPDVAEAALEKVKAQFDVPEAKVDDQNIFEHLEKVAPGPSVLAHGGDLDEGRKLAAKTFQRTYLDSYVAHATIETHTALASIEGEKATVWASTQNPFGAQREIAQALGFSPQNVRVIAPFVGGGFGGKTQNSQAVEAARLAKLVGKPVQVCRTRQEEFFYDTFRPAAIIKLDSGIDSAGKITFWDYEVFYAGSRGAGQFYAVPHHRTTARGAGWTGPPGSHPFATGAWRAPGNSSNTFARESQIDLMAAAAGIDPVEFRLNNLADKRMIRALKAAAERFGWTPAKAPSKRGYGVACGTDAGACVAAIAEVAVDAAKGAVQVKRVVYGVDLGLVVNPEGARLQIEGSITMGMGYALTEQVHFKGGQVLDTGFDTYELPRFSWVPGIEIVLIDAKETPPQGGGEPAIILMGALIANAIHDATGARLLRMPMTRERVKLALAG